jgi:hypothetical protein
MIRQNATSAQLTIPFGIPTYWTPEQALAVVELLDGLRELIWDRYGMQMFDELRKENSPRRSDLFDDPDDRPF